MPQLNTICSPDEYVGITDLHKHRCPNCGTCWKHRGSECRTGRTFDLGHTCPNCGEFVDMKYYSAAELEERKTNLALLELIALFEELAGNVKAYDREFIDPDFDD